jgi:hypothetical protein
MIRTVHLCLVALLLTLAWGFAPLTTVSFSTPTTSTRLWSEAPTAENGPTAAESKPNTYAQCGRCQSAFPLQAEDLGNGRGR